MSMGFAVLSPWAPQSRLIRLRQTVIRVRGVGQQGRRHGRHQPVDRTFSLHTVPQCLNRVSLENRVRLGHRAARIVTGKNGAMSREGFDTCWR